jgi:hypothetical protein
VQDLLRRLAAHYDKLADDTEATGAAPLAVRHPVCERSPV